MQHHGHPDFRRLVQILIDGYAVIAYRAIYTAARRSQIREPPAQTESQCADLARDFSPRTQRAHGGADVVHAFVGIETPEEVEGAREVCLGVTQFDILLQPPEQIRRKHHITFFGVVIGDLADVGIDAEDFLAQHNARSFARCWHGEISPERATIRSFNVDPFSGHFQFLHCVYSSSNYEADLLTRPGDSCQTVAGSSRGHWTSQ